ncbi:MAG: hypothetical protein ACKO2C_03400 [Actinomycetes bacterium]
MLTGTAPTDPERQPPVRPSPIRRVLASVLLVPVVVLAVVSVLALLRVNGSSVALLDEGRPTDTVGSVRSVRSDEWRGRTPLVVRQSRTGFPATTDLGMGRHDTGVLSDLPVWAAPTVLRPHHLVYFVVGVDRAFAFEWWLEVVGPLLGLYGLVVVITGDRLVATLTGLVVALAPVFGWWSTAGAGFMVLYGALAAAAFVVALRTDGWRRPVAAMAAGWSAACFATLLYLPWLVPLALVFGAVALGEAFGLIQAQGARGASRVLVPTALLAGVVGGAGAALFLAAHRDALEAISASVYPGRRVSTGGESRLVQLLSAPLGLLTNGRRTVEVAGVNQSEAASGLMLGLPVVLAGGAFGGFRVRTPVARALTAVSLVFVVLACWAVLPVPTGVGRLLLLTSVPGKRMAMPLAVAGALAAGLYAHRARSEPGFRPSWWRVAIAAGVFAGLTSFAVHGFTVDGQRLDPVLAVGAAVLVGVLAALVLRGQVLLGLGGACVLLAVSSATINPLQRRLDPITRSPLLAQIDAVRSTDPDGRWVSTPGDEPAFAILAASGAPAASGTSWYADAARWRRVDPDPRLERVWNRFAYVYVFVEDRTTGPRLRIGRTEDVVEVRLGSCDPAFGRVRIRYLIATGPQGAPCLRQLAVPTRPGERYLYEVLPPAR